MYDSNPGGKCDKSSSSLVSLLSEDMSTKFFCGTTYTLLIFELEELIDSAIEPDES